MGENTEEKLRLENETASLKREYKYALENLNTIKKETAEILSLKDQASKEIGIKKDELREVLNEISSEKLNWALERQTQIAEMANKISEAENVLKRKAELNEQEEKIRQLEASDIEARNEARQLELKVQDDKDIIAVEKRTLEQEKKQLVRKEEQLLKDQENFRDKVIKILKEVEKI